MVCVRNAKKSAESPRFRNVQCASKYRVPERKDEAEVLVPMLRIRTVVNLVLCWADEYPKLRTGPYESHMCEWRS